MLIPTALVRSAARTLAVVLVFCAGLSSLPASAQNPRRPLLKDEVVELLKGGVSSRRVADIAHDRGINFELTPEAEDELRGAGATDELIRTLQELAPKPAQIVVETSPDAQVYLDDTLVGQASPQGRLVIGSPKPGDHTLRISRGQEAIPTTRHGCGRTSSHGEGHAGGGWAIARDAATLPRPIFDGKVAWNSDAGQTRASCFPGDHGTGWPKRWLD